VMYGTWLIPWRAPPPSLGAAVSRLSTLGFWSVTLIAATGVYALLSNLWGPQALAATPYGLALLVKLALVCAVLAAGAVNRWVVIPALRRPGAAGALGAVIKTESLLLLAVLGVTSVLVVQPPPTTAPTLSQPLSFREATADAWIVEGTIERRDPGRFAVDLRVNDARGSPAPPEASVELTLQMTEHAMAPVRTTLAPVGPGAYRGAFFLPMTGRWQMSVRAGAHTAQVPIQTEEAMFIRPLRTWRAILPAAALIAVGMGCVAFGLRRLGNGQGGGWVPLGAGAAVFIAGVLLAVRAAG